MDVRTAQQQRLRNVNENPSGFGFLYHAQLQLNRRLNPIRLILRETDQLKRYV